MNRKQKIMRLAGGDVRAAWLLDTLIWAEDKGYRWTLTKAAEVAGMTYKQARRAADTLQERGVIDAPRRGRGGVSVAVDLDESAQGGQSREFESAQGGHSRVTRVGTPECPGWALPTYTCTGGTDMQRRDQENTLNDLLGIGGDEGVSDTPPRKRLDISRREPPEADLDEIVKLTSNVRNVAKLWSVLNHRAGKHPSIGRAWKQEALLNALKHDGLTLDDIRFVYERWERWRTYLKEQTGMKAPNIPFLWHIGTNVGLIEGFRKSGLGSSGEAGYDDDLDASEFF